MTTKVHLAMMVELLSLSAREFNKLMQMAIKQPLDNGYTVEGPKIRVIKAISGKASWTAGEVGISLKEAVELYDQHANDGAINLHQAYGDFLGRDYDWEACMRRCEEDSRITVKQSRLPNVGDVDKARQKARDEFRQEVYGMIRKAERAQEERSDISFEMKGELKVLLSTLALVVSGTD